MSSKIDRIKGVLAGQAVADALGMGYEFRPTIGPGEEAVMRDGVMFPEGSWTDDTEQAIVVTLAGLVAKNLMTFGREVAMGMRDWYATRPRDVGRQTATVLGGAWDSFEVIRRSASYGEYMTSKPKRPGQDPGLANGSLMRTGPVALLGLGDRPHVAHLARTQSEVTHADPTGYTGDACVIWSLVIEQAVQQGAQSFDLLEAVTDAIGYVPESRRDFWLETAAQAIANPAIPEGRNGSAVGAFKVAINAVARTASYEDAIQRAIHAGHDTDTTAAITGMLAGAMYGMHAIPQAWRNAAHGQAGPHPGVMYLADLAELAQCAANGQTFNLPAYATEEPQKGISPFMKAGGHPGSR